MLYGCLGHDSRVDIKPFLNKKKSDGLTKIIKKTIFNKPEKHYFSINSKSSVSRFMNTTGG